MILTNKKQAIATLGALGVVSAIGVTAQAEEMVIEGESVNKKDDLTKPNTYWYSEKGEELKAVAYDETLPDSDGNDIKDHTLVRTHVVTAEDLKTTLSETDFKVGDTLNIYKPVVEKESDTITYKKDIKDVDETGKELKQLDGYILSHTTEDEHNKVNHYIKADKSDKKIDEDGNTIEKTDGYKLIVTKTEPSGNKTHIYHKIMTSYVDESGNVLKDPVMGSLIDEGDGIVEGHGLVKTDIRENGDVINVYKKVITKWVDEAGNTLMPDKAGRHLDKEGDDIKNHYLLKGYVDNDGNVINQYKKTVANTTNENDPANPQNNKEDKPVDTKADKASDKKDDKVLDKKDDKVSDKNEDKALDKKDKQEKEMELEEQKGPVVKNAASQLTPKTPTSSSTQSLPKTGDSEISYLYGLILSILAMFGIRISKTKY